jgi:hypothetical protein
MLGKLVIFVQLLLLLGLCVMRLPLLMVWIGEMMLLPSSSSAAATS